MPRSLPGDTENQGALAQLCHRSIEAGPGETGYLGATLSERIDNSARRCIQRPDFLVKLGGLFAGIPARPMQARRLSGQPSCGLARARSYRRPAEHPE